MECKFPFLRNLVFSGKEGKSSFPLGIQNWQEGKFFRSRNWCDAGIKEMLHVLHNNHQVL